MSATVYGQMAYTSPVVSATTLEPPGLLGYQLRLPSFEGPFDVLLRLVERNQLPITDVSLVAVTDQFLAYLEELGGAAPEAIAEFASVGARLVLLKSRSLLPRPAAAEDESASSELARQLIEYQAMKRAADELAERDRRGEGAFVRATGAIAVPTESAPPKLAAHEPVSLVRALRRRLAVIPSPREIVSARPLISLATMIERVLGTLTGRGEARFSTVAGGCRDGHELRTAFFAVLVLIRRRVIDAEQETPFGEITLRQRPAAWHFPVDYRAGEAAD
ncbi:MAG: segregation and condensation protein, partial [Thermomicrobiales bacterium]|nr:segregation and condensation protein [Thermomicrobiales bacterium]